MPDTLAVHDEFTGTSGTALEAHVPTAAGTGWTAEFKEPVSPTTMQITVGGTIFPNLTRNSERVIYSAQPNPTGANQRVQARFRDRGPADDPWILFGRADAGNWDNGYGVACYAASTKLYRKIGGVVTQLGATGPTIATASIVTLNIIGNQLQVLDDGVAILTVTDAQITQSGRWGIAAGDLFVPTDDIDGQEFDSFQAWDLEDVVTASPTTGTLQITGGVPTIWAGIVPHWPPPWRVFPI